MADKILAALSAPYRLSLRLKDHEITAEHHCTASIGVVLFINHENNCDDLIKHADIAMYQAKDDGRNRIHFFNPASD